MIGPEATPRRRDDLEAQREADEVLLLHKGVEVCRLNDTAFALWQLCDGATTAAEMMAAVRDASGLDARVAERDVAAALDDLRRSGALG